MNNIKGAFFSNYSDGSVSNVIARTLMQELEDEPDPEKVDRLLKIRENCQHAFFKIKGRYNTYECNRCGHVVLTPCLHNN